MEFYPARIRELREEHGMTQSALAAKIGCAASTISMYEQGRREPTFEVLRAIAAVFSVPVESFINSPTPSEDEEIWSLREELRRRPEMRMLFSVSKKASREDIMKTVKIIEALRGNADS